MNKNDYIEKSMAILVDATKFKTLDKDLTRTKENRLHAILLKMKVKKQMNNTKQCDQREQSLENFKDCRKHIRKTTRYDQ